MSLYRRGDIWWCDFTVKRRRYRESTGFKRKADAAEYQEARKRELRLGASAPKDLTLYDAANRWFASRAAGLKSEKTIAQRLEIMLRHMDGGLMVSKIGAADIEAAIQARRVEVTRQKKLPSNTTVNRDLIDTTLRPILSYCAEILEVEVRRIAWGKLRLPEPAARNRPITALEQEQWRAALPPWHRDLFDFYRRYGPRLREAFFHPSAYDERTGRLTLRQRKAGDDHVIVLIPEDRPAMQARLARAREAGLPTVWFRDNGGVLEPIHWRAFQSASRQALLKAKIPDARPAHDLRHHAATELVRGSGNLAAAQRLLGHRHIATTMRYAHADDEDVLGALRHTYGTERGKETQKSKKIKASRAKISGT